MMSNNEWRDNLKVGDRVVIGGYTADTISSVERLTETLIITNGGKFRRRDGCSPGNGWHRNTLQEPTPEVVDRIRQENLARKFCHYDWKTLPLETLRAVFKLLPKGT